MNDTVINKIQSIQRCVQRARQEYLSAGESFKYNYTVQDAAILNVMRACEQSIDLADYAIKKRQLGIPTTSAESFELLRQEEVVDPDLAQRLKKMVGFRNTIIHNIQEVKLEVVKEIIESGLDDLLALTDCIRLHLDDASS